MPKHVPDLDAIQELVRALAARRIGGPLFMLNLLRFREVADYSGAPELAPASPVSGAHAYRIYLEHARPFVEQAAGELSFVGRGGAFLVGPAAERWDAVLLIRYRSVADFHSVMRNPSYLAGLGHRLASLEDSRLLPLEEISASEL